MFNVVVEIKAPEITEAIWALIGSLANSKIGGAPAQTPIMPTIQQEQQVQQTQPQQAQYFPPMLEQQPQQIPPQQQAQPQQTPQQQQAQLMPQQIPQQQTQPSVVPTTVQTYTIEQLAVAATQLMDAGRKNDLIALLGSFGVQALTALPKEQYGNFATQLRTMGAKI